jgi:hypothetical protein
MGKIGHRIAHWQIERWGYGSGGELIVEEETGLVFIKLVIS